MKASRRTIQLGVLLVVGAVVLYGCGGGGGGGGNGAGKRLTKVEFAAKANALCADYMLKSAALPNSTSAAAGVKVVADTRDLFAKEIAGMKKLRPPAEEQATVNRVLKLTDQRLALMNREIAALQHGHPEQVPKLIKSGAAAKSESNGLFGRLGATTCVI